MHDGQNLFDPATSFLGVDWGIGGTMSRLIAAGTVREAIVVGIWNTAERDREYMPEQPLAMPRAAEVRRDQVEEGPLLSDAYLRFLVTELKPWVDATYPTAPGRADTFVVGASLGGLISLYALTEYPQVFGGAGCLSPHWPAGEGIVIDYLEAVLPPPAGHRLYFDHGTEGLDAAYAPYQRWVDEVMRAAGYVEGKDWMTRVFPGAEHSEVAWRERVHLPLTFLLGPPGADHPSGG
jgi:predicted alpha/beta superfamily hydrolase